MSDMSRSRSLPPAAPDHERHDALLVAQFVAGDPLKPEQQTEAHRLVTTCGACAALAADLPAVSRAVAREPVPARHRDFRLSPETALELRGNALTRFLRGRSLPSSRAFQPAAAGVLSIGLLFMVAGYAWPDGGTVTVQAEPNFADWGTAAPSAGSLEAQPAPALVAEPEAAEDVVLGGAEQTLEDPDFADSLARSQAGMSEGSTQKSRLGDEDALVADDAAKAGQAEALQAEAYSSASEAEVTEIDASADSALAPDGADGDAALEQRDAAREQRDAAREQQDAAIDQQDETAAAATVEAPKEETTGTGAAAELTAVPADDGPEDLLIVLGLALAFAGGGLLLLGWLARRARDPLAP